MNRRPPRSTRTETRFPYTTLFRSDRAAPWALLLPAPYSPLDAHRDAHAAADAQGRKTLLRIVLLHLIEQGDQHARARCADRMADRDRAARSEEHTSELQSLMRISYAVFCLKTKKKKTTLSPT